MSTHSDKQNTSSFQIPLADAVRLSEPCNWRYIAEGAANLVVVHDPDHQQSQSTSGVLTGLECKALRLRKRTIADDRNDHHKMPQPEGPNSVEPAAMTQEANARLTTAQNENLAFIGFQERVVAQLFKPQDILHFTLVQLDANWIQALDSAIHSHRLDDHRTRSELDKTCPLGFVMEDLAGALTESGGVVEMAFEIKPKWTFLPPSIESLKPDHREIKSGYCRTCIYRTVRATSASSEEDLNPYYTSKTRFCPLMLFGSSDLKTVRDAVGRLYCEWISAATPNSLGRPTGSEDHRPSQLHNNFRVFRNGLMVKPGEMELDEKTLDLLAIGIHQSSGMRRLDELQRRLDPIDLDGISGLLASKPHDADLDRPIELTEFEALLPLITSQMSAAEYNVSFEKLTIRQKVVLYMLSMTLKDCSVFIRIIKTQGQQSSDEELSSASSAQSSQKVEIKMIDLDLKPLSRLKKYIARDTEVLSHFKQLLHSAACSIPCVELP
ncbi:inositol-pentakisphosphate 2-kinase [Melampsora americana]|nr:inositol-pentakisphosphate 2-kinase [Melampsora americana]